MNSIEDFVDLVGDELGLTLNATDADRALDEIEGWDSVHLLTLLTALERRTGRSVPLAEVLEASSLRGIYTLTVPDRR